MTDFQSVIDRRRSRRRYLPTALDLHSVKMLQESISEFNANETAKMRLVLNNGDALNGILKSYGMFSGVRNYIALIGDSSDTLGLEKLGYYGESLVLQATAMGLGTCWVGSSFNRASCPFKLEDGESVICVIAVGNVPREPSAKENLIRGVVHRKSKTIGQMSTTEGPVPEWFISGMRAVQKAPSAANGQPVMFSYQDGIVTASVKNITGRFYAVDLGIAKLHFELGAMGGVWAFGNGAEFKKS